MSRHETQMELAKRTRKAKSTAIPLSNSTKAHICTSTNAWSEIRVDYAPSGERTVAFIDAPPDSLQNRLMAASSLWMSATLIYAAIPMGLWAGAVARGWLPSTWSPWLVAWLYMGAVAAVVLAHIPPAWDRWLKRPLIHRTGHGPKNKLEVSDFTGTEFVLPAVQNVVLVYRATGDVAAQLVQVWVRPEHPSSAAARQARITSLSYLKNADIWNAHFRFAQRPTSGSLALEWI